MKKAAKHGSQAMESSTTIVAANPHDVLDLDSADLGQCVSANEADQSQEKSQNPSVFVSSNSRETEKDLLTLPFKQVRNVSDGFKASGKGNPCPICGRVKDGDCRIGAEIVLCHHGSSHHPPEGLKPGETHIGADGQQWAYTKDTSDGRAATYVIHQPLPVVASQPRRIRFSPLPEVTAEPPSHLPNGQRLKYSDTQTVVVVVAGDSKKHIPHHINSSGKEVKGAGAEPWPLWKQANAIKYGAGKWIIETEGEKCTAWLSAAGLVAVSQPGHDTNEHSITGRYKALRASGVAGVAYLADNDETGVAKGAKCQKAAATAELPFLLLQAAEVWPGICAGGSIDDAPGSAQERAQVLQKAIQKTPTPPAKQQDNPAATPSSKPSKSQERKARHLSHTKSMACFDRCVEVQAQRERNSLRRRARLLKAAKDLGLAAYINRQEIAQKVLEAKARCGGEGFKPLTAADRAAMPKPVVRWLVGGLIPAKDLTIIGGRPKVGKTRVAVAIVAAVLRGEPFLEFSAPTSSPPVLLVTDDQSAGDTATMLTALNLWDHPRLIWSEHFRLTEPDLDALLDAIKANPSAVVVLDSLRSIGRALTHGENESEIGATLYDLKQSVIEAGGTLLLIHHCNKAADLVGVEALSGHNAIGGAANTIITLHHCPNDKGLPDKINPQRRLFSEGRSGEGCDVVIDRGAGAGTYRQVSTYEHWLQQLAAAKKNQKLERLTDLQQQVLDALEDSSAWMTRRQVCEAIGITWTERGRGGDARKVGDALQRLVALEQAESVRAGTEATYRASCETQKDTVTSVPINDTNGSQCHEQPRDSRDNRDMARLSQSVRDTETDCDDSLAWLSRTSQPLCAPQRQENEQRIRELGHSTDLRGWSDDEVADLVQSLEQAARRQAGSGLLV